MSATLVNDEGWLMADAGWFDDGSGKQRWWDGTAWTDRYLETVSIDPLPEGPTAPSGLKPRRVFHGNGTAGSKTLTVYENLVEFEHLNYFVAVPLAKLGPVGYSKKQKAPYDGVNVTADIDFHCDNPKEVYEYLRALVAAS